MWLRLRQVALVAEELAPVVDQLGEVFGLEVAYRDPGVGVFGLENAVLPVGHQFLEVVAPVEEGTTAGRYLQRRKGPGGYMVITHTDDHEAVRSRIQALGIRTVLDFDEHGYRCLQLHPRDTGGSFLEIDRQEGGEDPSGPWAPAGRTWQDAIRTDVVDGIRAVDVQAEDPAAVATRWSDIVQIPLRRDDGATGDDDGGAVVLPLDNADVRFVPATDDRGDGLSTVELSVVDLDAAVSAASARGLVDDRGSITLCGTKFRLVPAAT